MTSACRLTAASLAQAVTSAARDLPTARCTGRGVPGRALKRHTPTLWNLAWSSPVFWDGRARSLEEQVAGPIESPDEMAQPLASVISRLAADPAMVAHSPRHFRRRRRSTPRISPRRLRPTNGHSCRRSPGSTDLSSAMRGAEPERTRRLPAVHRQGRLRQVPQRLRLHRLCLPRHRLAGRRPRPRFGSAAGSGRSCFQDAGAARDRPLGALHARRLAGDARRRRPALREWHRRAAHALQGPDAWAQADRR